MIIRIAITCIIFTLFCLPVIVVSVPVVAILLRTSWDGRTTIFGNAKWGKGENNPAWLKKGYWAAFGWLVIRNPVNNLFSRTLAAPQKSYMLEGKPNTGDKSQGGFYYIRMCAYWEIYIVIPYRLYGPRCFRLRMGWKIKDNTESVAPFVCAITPFKKYLGN